MGCTRVRVARSGAVRFQALYVDVKGRWLSAGTQVDPRPRGRGAVQADVDVRGRLLGRLAHHRGDGEVASPSGGSAGGSGRT